MEINSDTNKHDFPPSTSKINIGVRVNLEINNVTKSPIESGFFEMVVRKTFEKLNSDFWRNKEISISVGLIAPLEIKKINKKYRKYDSVTDVLSFPEYETAADLQKEVGSKEGGKLFLGELILCYDDIKEYAQKTGVDFEKEFSKVVAHGVLHLLGLEHGEKMFQIQQAVADEIIKS